MRSTLIKSIIPLLTAIAMAGTATAAPRPPDEIIKSTTDELQKTIQEGQEEFKKDPGKLYALMEESVVPLFDVRYIAQLILARHWRKASEAQRERFQVAFKDMLIRTYATAMVDNSDSVKAEFMPLRIKPDATEAKVDSKLLRPNKPPVPISFAMRLKDGDWKIYDIVIENLSLIQNFRSQISSQIKKSSLDEVIARLESDARNAAATPGEAGKESESRDAAKGESGASHGKAGAE